MKILIADDDARYRQSLQEILEGGDNTIVTAEDGEMAVIEYQKNDDIDLVITDFSMPKKNGLAVIKEIRMIQPKARIWLASSVMDDEMKSMAIEAGAEQAIWKMDIRDHLRQWSIL